MSTGQSFGESAQDPLEPSQIHSLSDAEVRELLTRFSLAPQPDSAQTTVKDVSELTGVPVATIQRITSEIRTTQLKKTLEEYGDRLSQAEQRLNQVTESQAVGPVVYHQTNGLSRNLNPAQVQRVLLTFTLALMVMGFGLILMYASRRAAVTPLDAPPATQAIPGDPVPLPSPTVQDSSVPRSN